MNICFIVNKNLDPNSLSFIYPILLNKKFLDFNIEIENKIPSKNYDIIIIDSKFFIDLFNLDNTELVTDILNKLKMKNGKVIYSDNEASTFINREIINAVDYYIKGRLPKDLNLYKTKLYGMREYTDFYFKKFNITDTKEKYSDIINDDNLKKINLGWNNGINEYSYFSEYNRKVYKLFGFFKSKPEIKNFKKKNLLNVRFSQNYNRETVNFQRSKLKDLINNFKLTKRVSRIKYFFELKYSKVALSPFGWGEICYRDFETFYYGCTLVKPDMDHIMTWPNYYQKNITYLSLNWDMSNFEELINLINNKKNSDFLNEIAAEGQKFYFNHLSSGIDSPFVKHFRNLMMKVQN